MDIRACREEIAAPLWLDFSFEISLELEIVGFEALRPDLLDILEEEAEFEYTCEALVL